MGWVEIFSGVVRGGEGQSLWLCGEEHSGTGNSTCEGPGVKLICSGLRTARRPGRPKQGELGERAEGGVRGVGQTPWLLWGGLGGGRETSEDAAVIQVRDDGGWTREREGET